MRVPNGLSGSKQESSILARMQRIPPYPAAFRPETTQNPEKNKVAAGGLKKT
ncbi:MAG TPA: hypothetical protein PLG97_13785 [Alcaligenes sp.]|nr:hypothetical protein [Alcaligenes sp.]